MRIRAATLEDHRKLCPLWGEADRLHAEILPEYFRPPPDPPRSQVDLRRQLAEADRLTLVAEEHDELVGLVEARLVDTVRQPQLTPRRRLYLEELVVSTRWRGRGAGRALLEAAEAWGRGCGAVEILLTVWEGNHDAERFYDRRGFCRLNQVLGRPLTP